MREYVLPESDVNKMKYNCDNVLFEQPKEPSAKVTIVLKKEHLPILDKLMSYKEDKR